MSYARRQQYLYQTTVRHVEHEKFFRDVFMAYLKGLFLYSPEYRSPPVRIDSEQINFDEVPLVKTKLSLCLGFTI
jgi:hypothetical protein